MKIQIFPQSGNLKTLINIPIAKWIPPGPCRAGFGLLSGFLYVWKGHVALAPPPSAMIPLP